MYSSKILARGLIALITVLHLPALVGVAGWLVLAPTTPGGSQDAGVVLAVFFGKPLQGVAFMASLAAVIFLREVRTSWWFWGVTALAGIAGTQWHRVYSG